MALVRLTLLFHHQSSDTGSPNAPPVRVAGWSESFYYDDTTPGVDVSGLMATRAALLPQGAFIVGQRYQFADGSSRSDTRRVNSNTGLSVDVPQMSLLCSARNLELQSTRRFMIRGLPDAWVVNGELVSGPDGRSVRTRLVNYFDALGSGFSWKARNPGGAEADVATITNPGLATVLQDLPAFIGTLLRAKRVKDIYGRSVNGTFRVGTDPVPLSKVFPLVGWPNTAVVGKGKLQIATFRQVPFVLKDITFSRVVVKKVGRNFFQYRGRAPKRRAI